ncbi:TetR family transcriptional regulator C-terminal domain-containing protein [Marinoscillum sp. MHG1-6]|uniref:TetR/AcrR family transcriptional regulator n=1 Tax=Marinoscillum sp. MHG1-6 TaxID=2959627 RepID=UPI002157E067|nr:TetR family transcriptional regulator C-terminal domain-containing protein [Marinoscillum sp. MHG1-6]
MEKTATKKAKRSITKSTLQKAYIDYLLTHGKQPVSIFEFAGELKATESDFYKHFNSFKALERSLWLDWFNSTVKLLEKDEAYAQYSVREKVLAFYFTWFETVMKHRSYIIFRFEKVRKELTPFFLLALKDAFDDYINMLLVEGKESTEIAERPFSKQYDKAFWLHFIFLNKFWTEDDSDDFQKTDAAIEKSVNLGLDLVGKGPLDSMIDFAKFLFQNKRPF